MTKSYKLSSHLTSVKIWQVVKAGRQTSYFNQELQKSIYLLH